MLPLCARRQNATGSFVWILFALCPPPFISGEAWKIDGLSIDFLPPSFGKHSSFHNLSFCHLLSSTCTLPVSFQRVLSLSLNFSLSLSYRLGMYHYSPSDHIYQNRRGKRHFQIPSASISQDSCGGLIQSLPDSDIQRYLSHWMPVSYASLQFVFLYSLQHSMQLPFLYNETVPFLCDCTYDDQVQRRLGTQEK